MSRPGRRLEPMVTVVAVAAALCGIGLGGCGSGTRVSGRVVFNADCADCHSISDTSSPEQQGGDLRGLRLSRGELAQFTTEMPVVNKPLTRKQMRAVVDYVRSVERRR